MRTQRNRPDSRLALFALVALTACGSEPTNPLGSTTQPVVQITVLEGDGQEVPAGQAFPRPVRVRVQVNGMPGSSVYYRLYEPEPGEKQGWASAVNGVATIQPTVGTQAGPFTLSISYLWCRGQESILSCQGTWVPLDPRTVSGTIVSSN